MSFIIRNALYNANLKELLNATIEAIDAQANTALLANPTLSIGSSDAKTVKNLAFQVVRDGVISTIASAETDFTATTHDIADGYEAVYLVYLTSANVITLLMGDQALGTGDAVAPSLPSGGLRVGTLTLSASGAIFNASTDELSAAHLTDVYANQTTVFVDIDEYDQADYLHNDYLYDLISAMHSVVVADGDRKILHNPTIAIGTSSAAKIKHGAFHVMTDGGLVTIATGEVAFTATTHDITADGATDQDAIYVISLNVSNAVIITKGDTADTGEAVAPSVPAGNVKMGELLLTVATGSTDFDASTDLLSAGHLTDVYSSKTIELTDFALSYTEDHYRHSKSLKTLVERILVMLGVMNNDKVLGNPTLSIGSSSAKTVKNLAFDVMRAGVFATVASAETAFTATTHDIADGYLATFLIYLNASNAITILKGTAVASGSTSVCPDTPANGFKLGEVVIEADGAIFNASTDDLSASHLTDTYSDLLEIIGQIV